MRTLSLLDPSGRSAWGRRNWILNAGTVAIILGGISLLVDAFGGLYWLLVTIGVYLPWAVINAWVLVVRVGRESREA
jgi:hypothetical protein